MSVCSTVVVLPRDRDKVFVVKRSRVLRTPKKIYIGRKSQLPPPPARLTQIQNMWQQVRRQDLERHIVTINREIRYQCQERRTRESVIETDLLLTGQKADGSVRLSPKIWFMCGSDWSEDIVREEIRGLTWMGNWGLGDKIEVGRKAAILLADETIKPSLALELDRGIRLPNGSFLHLNVETPQEASSALGLMCSVAVTSESKPTYHGISRIGGVFSITERNGKVVQVGVTAAHSILDHFLTVESSAKQPAKAKAWKRAGRNKTERKTSSTETAQSKKTVVPVGKVSQLSADTAHWESVPEVYSMNWLGGGWDAASEFQFPFRVSDPERLAIDADFALVRIPKELENTTTGESGFKEITWILDEASLESGPVQIIINASTLIEATLLTETPDLYLRGRHFPTRKLQLDRPLAPGTSGCWVIQKDKLCGMIVAGYETEPFAHMITAEKLVRDIEKTLGRGILVCLPAALREQPVPLARPTDDPLIRYRGRSYNSLDYSRDLLRRRDSYDTLPSNPIIKPRSINSYNSLDYDWPAELRRTRDSETDTSLSGSVVDFGANLRRNRHWVWKPRAEPIKELMPQLPEIASKDSSKFQSTLGNWLESHLIVSPTDGTKYFLPLDVLDTILDRNLVGRLAQDEDKREALCDYVCGPETDVGSTDRPPRTARKILAILILLERPDDITKFMADMVHDGDLPLRRYEQRGAQFRLGRSNGKEMSCFDQWKTLDIRQFDDFQWYMLSPFFTQSQHGKPLFYRLHDRVILPWVEYLETDEGGTATIHKTKIHAAHHDFNLTINDHVAVKQLRYNDRAQFDAELYAFQNLSPHPHLVSLLSSFNYQSSYFFMFQWANGGNLFDLWKSNKSAPGVSAPVVEWVLQQCRGLAGALNTIHNATKPNKARRRQFKDRDVEEAAEADALFGRHGDIKPENILWFHDGKSPGPGEAQSANDLCKGTLKISDFGLTEFHRDRTKSNVPASGVGMSLTYRAPELDTERSVSRAYDIWSMGCLYLEFITWLVLGWAGVDEFSYGRLADHGSGIREDSYFIVVQQEKTAWKVPRLNPFVTVWIEKLRSVKDLPKALANFLWFIETKMLVVDSRDRVSALQLYNFTGSLIRSSLALGSFHLNAVPVELPATEKVFSEPTKKNLPKSRSNRGSIYEPKLGSKGDATSKSPFRPSSLKSRRSWRKTSGEGILRPVEVETTEEYISREGNAEVRARFTHRRTYERRNEAFRHTGNAPATTSKHFSAYKEYYADMSALELVDVQAELLAKLTAIGEVQRQRALRFQDLDLPLEPEAKVVVSDAFAPRAGKQLDRELGSLRGEDPTMAAHF